MSDRKGPKATATGVALAYTAVSVVFVLSSDGLLDRFLPALAHDRTLETLKILGYVLLSALALWLVLVRILARLDLLLAEVSNARRRLRSALHAAGGISWRTELGANGKLTAILHGSPFHDGDLPVEIMQNLDQIEPRIHPESRAAHRALTDAIISGKDDLAPLTFRLRDAMGNWRWIKTVPDPESRPAGVPGAVSGVAFDVTDLQDTAQALEDVIAGGQLGTWRHDLRNDRLTVNEGWVAMLGYGLEELQPQLADDWRALVHPEDLPEIDRTRPEAGTRPDYFFSCEYRMRHKDGHWIWILSRGKAVETDETGKVLVLAGVHIDISQRVALKAALMEKSDFLQRLTETSVSGILSIDASGTIVFANLEAQQILDADGGGLVGRNQRDLGWKPRPVGAGDAAAGQPGFPVAQVLDGGEALRDLRLTLLLPDGGERVISVNAAPMQPRGGAAQIVCSVSDITQRLIDERRLAQVAEEARFAAGHDPLTGLPNRTLFEAHVGPALRAARRESGLVVQVFVRIDRFQQARDRFGPVLGERLLCLVAKRLEGLRRGPQVFARVGAEEFTLLDRLGVAEEVQGLTARLASAFETPFDLDGQPVYLSASMGVSLFPMDALIEEELWRNAELAMYEAKARGGNRTEHFTTALRDRVAREARIGQALQGAIRERAFDLVLQPKVCINDPGVLVGAEALVRCNAPELTDIGPAEFMPVAERTGLIRAIDLIMIDRVGAFLETLAARGMHLHVAINLSPESLRQSGFGAEVLDHARANGLGPEKVQFELTEGAMLDLQSEARGNIELLLAQGYALSADDFGTGYSSLSYLQKLRLKEIKIDQSFVKRLGRPDGASEAIICATLAMAKALGLRTVAEGVDTRAQLDWLAAQGCDIGQGYHFGRPLAPEDFVETFLSDRPPPQQLCGAAR